MKNKIKGVLLLLLLGISSYLYANQTYLCGNDEDGCDLNNPTSCVIVTVSDYYQRNLPDICKRESYSVVECLNMYLESIPNPSNGCKLLSHYVDPDLFSK